MSLILLQNITKRFGGEDILHDISFRVEESDKVGLIGRNGTGKSTLFRLIMGELTPDLGVIERMRRARIACLAQFPDIDASESVFDVVMGRFADLIDMERRLADLEEKLADHNDSLLAQYSALQTEFDHRGGYDFRHRANRVLHGLGFTRDEFALPVTALSGGQRTRLMLALVLLEDADLLLLDEPENHLDIQAREWLETFLKNSPRAFVMISHDRRMLNAVVNRVVEVERCQLRSYAGTYDDFIAQKELAREQQQKAFERQQRDIEREQAWIDRFRYKATKARQAQSRIKRLDKVERIDAPDADMAAAQFRMGGVVRSGAVVLTAESLSIAYGNLCLYHDVSFKIERGERVGIIGPNGSGKTTLLRQLAGRLDPGSGKLTGSVTPGHKVSVGYYDQHHESINRANDIFTEIRECRPDLTPERVRSFMGRFLFSDDDIFKPIANLSGGELGRVAIAKLILQGANLLLLDEPTNHLDIATREILEAALAEYEGALVIVSHDRALIDRLAERLFIVQDGHVRIHLGNYSNYRLSLESGQTAVDPDHTPTADEVMKIRLGKTAKSRDKDRQRSNESRKRRRELEDLERDIANLEEVITDIESRFGDVDPADFDRLRAMTDEYEGLKNDLRAMYAAWEELAEMLETG